jgi:hypothetical protein
MGFYEWRLRITLAAASADRGRNHQMLVAPSVPMQMDLHGLGMETMKDQTTDQNSPLTSTIERQALTPSNLTMLQLLQFWRARYRHRQDHGAIRAAPQSGAT